MSWFNPSWHVSLTELLPHTPLQWDGVRHWKGKRENSCAEIELDRKMKVAYTNKEKQKIHSTLPMDRQVFNHLQENRTPSCVTVNWCCGLTPARKQLRGSCSVTHPPLGQQENGKGKR